MYKVITINDIDYKCVLTASACVEVEQKLGKNPLTIFFDGMPKIGDLLIVFHASLKKFQHNIKLDDCFELYDKYIEDGGSMTDFVNEVMDIFKESGFIKEDKENEGKNA